jgi:hypothetical protein
MTQYYEVLMDGYVSLFSEEKVTLPWKCKVEKVYGGGFNHILPRKYNVEFYMWCRDNGILSQEKFEYRRKMELHYGVK